MSKYDVADVDTTSGTVKFGDECYRVNMLSGGEGWDVIAPDGTSRRVDRVLDQNFTSSTTPGLEAAIAAWTRQLKSESKL